jgi:hypothetical protein
MKRFFGYVLILSSVFSISSQNPKSVLLETGSLAMKTFRAIIPLLIFLFLFPQCRKNASAPVPSEQQTLQHIETLLGGCNDMKNPPLAKNQKTKNDTVYYEWKGDTLAFHIGINHICCVKFRAEYALEKDTLRLKIRDVCTKSELCYCSCECYYTFDYLFSGTSTLPDVFEVSLYDAWWDTTEILCRGIISRK